MSSETHTHVPLPSATAAFIETLRTFLIEELAQRHADAFNPFVVTGGELTTGAGLTGTPTPLTAYPGGYYIVETGSITFAANKTSYVIAHKSITGDVGTFVRVAGTHYAIDSTSDEPNLPDDSVWIAKVTTLDGSISAVEDRRVLAPVGPSAGGTGLDTSAAANGQLLIGNGAGFTLATLAAGAGIAITNGSGSITIAAGGGTWGSRGNASFTASTTTFTLAAQVVMLRNASNNVIVRHNPSNVTNTVTTAGPAADGRDQAAAFTAETFVHFYWVWNGTTLASVSSAAAPPTGPTLPTGYTHWAYDSSVWFTAGSTLTFVRVRGAWVYHDAEREALAAGAATTETSVALGDFIPALAMGVKLRVRATVEGDGVGNVDTAVALRVITTKDYVSWPLESASAGPFYDAFVDTELTVPNVAQNLFYVWANATNVAVAALKLGVLAYEVPNGG